MKNAEVLTHPYERPAIAVSLPTGNYPLLLLQHFPKHFFGGGIPFIVVGRLVVAIPFNGVARRQGAFGKAIDQQAHLPPRLLPEVFEQAFGFRVGVLCLRQFVGNRMGTIGKDPIGLHHRPQLMAWRGWLRWGWGGRGRRVA